jgi:tryptophan synthase beta chain
MLHQSIIGLETMAALEKYDEKADIIIGCAGGGSNLGGLIAPFVRDKIKGKADYEIIAVEPASCPSFTRGQFKYDYCDTGMVCPLQKMYTLGNGFIPSASHAGGLRYHGMSSTLSQLYHDKIMSARTVTQVEVFDAAEKLEENGFAKVIETDSAFYVIQLESKCDEEATTAKKESIVEERKSETVTETIEKWRKDAKIKVNDKVWDKISMHDIQVTEKKEEAEESTDGTTETLENVTTDDVTVIE